MIDTDKIISDALSNARAIIAAEVAARGTLIARLQAQYDDLGKTIANLNAALADSNADITAIDAKAIAVKV